VVDQARLHYGLNFLGRSADEMEPLVSESGFTDVVVRSPRKSITIPKEDDSTRQHWLTACHR